VKGQAFYIGFPYNASHQVHATASQSR